MTDNPHSESLAAVPTDEQEAAQPRPPLGLPSGSVRAILTLIVVLFIVIQTARGITLSILWTETLMIVLAHYFTSRRFVPLSPKLMAELEAEGKIERESTPLYLPRWTVRGLVVGSFVGLAVYLGMIGQLFETQAVTLLGTVGAYFCGMLFRTAVAWWTRNNAGGQPTWWSDLKAALAIGFIGATVVLRLSGSIDIVPFPAGLLEDITLGIVLFYFGSR